MAFDQQDLSVWAYANGTTLWHYSTRDKLKKVLATGYFNRARDMMRAGDFIYLSVFRLGDVQCCQAAVTYNDGDHVVVEPLAQTPSSRPGVVCHVAGPGSSGSGGLGHHRTPPADANEMRVRSR